MKKLFLFFCALCIAIGLQAQVSKTVNLTTAETLSTMLTADELVTVTDLTLSGNIDARDFVPMRDAMKVLENVDMSAAIIFAYTGKERTYGVYGTGVYKANVLPENSFYHFKRKLNIKLPNMLTSIGKAAFQDCRGLITISIPSSVSSIDTLAFNYCCNLTTISIFGSLTTIGENAFYGCSGLTSIRVFNSTPVVLLSSSVFLTSPKPFRSMFHQAQRQHTQQQRDGASLQIL